VLDVSNNRDVHNYGSQDGAGFAQELAVGIKDNGAITRLNISNNQLCGHWKTPDFSGFKALAAAIEQHKLLTMVTVDMSEALDVAGQNLGTAGAKMMATFIKGNGALTSLNLASNHLNAEGVKIVAKAIAVTNCAIAVVLAPFSCLADHWLNCCCLLLSTG
jgi:hypothetical protein